MAMPETYTVKSVWSKPREWQSSHGGSFLSYKVDFEDSDGSLLKGIEWTKKTESQPPTVGERVAGHLEEGPYSEKFKIDYEATKELGPQRSSGARSGSPGGPGRSWTPEAERDPQRVAAMQCSHAQEMAVSTCLAEDIPLLENQELTSRYRFVRELYEQEVREVSGQAATSGQDIAPNTEVEHGNRPSEPGGGGSTATPAQNSPPAEEHQHRIEDLMMDAKVPVPEVGWVFKKGYLPMLEEERSNCDAWLASKDPSQTKAAAERLTERAGPMPESEKSDESIPF